MINAIGRFRCLSYFYQKIKFLSFGHWLEESILKTTFALLFDRFLICAGDFFLGEIKWTVIVVLINASIEFVIFLHSLPTKRFIACIVAATPSYSDFLVHISYTLTTPLKALIINTQALQNQIIIINAFFKLSLLQKNRQFFC